jgi:hypothetical protein
LLLDQLLDGLASPQRLWDAQVMGQLAVDEILDGLFLLGLEKATGANRTSGAITRKGLFTALFVLDTPAGNGLLANAEDGGNIADRVTKFAGVDGAHAQGFQDFVGLRPSIRQFDSHRPGSCSPPLRHHPTTGLFVPFTIALPCHTSR